jgi:hypothetical protein
MSKKSIQKTLKKHTESLMSYTGVVGTAQGVHQGNPCIAVFINQENPELIKKIPKFLDGYPVIIEVTGPVKPLDE